MWDVFVLHVTLNAGFTRVTLNLYMIQAGGPGIAREKKNFFLKIKYLEKKCQFF